MSESGSAAEALRALVAVMREMGVTRYQSGDVLVELGDQPREPGPRLTETQKAHARKTTAEYVDQIMFASSEGFPTDGEEPLR
jgi:hypothetical protein